MKLPGRVYGYENSSSSHSHAYLVPCLSDAIERANLKAGSRVLDYGSGNGSLSGWLSNEGFSVFGVDASPSGVAIARQSVPEAEFSDDISLENITSRGPFDLVVCVEVIAHCFAPQDELAKMYRVLKPGGTLVISTPYHSYLKNLAMAVTGSLEAHLDTLWSGAYVHFFTFKSISALLAEAGFEGIAMVRAGRIPIVAKSMILTCRKPS